MIERRTFLTGIAGVGAIAVVGCGSDDTSPTKPHAATKATPTSPSTPGPVNPKIASTIATGLNVPWGIAFLPNGEAYVSLRDDATIVRVSPAGIVSPVVQVSDAAGRAGGEGGLLGLALAGDDLFAYVSTDEEDKVVRMSIDGYKVGKATTILDGIKIGSRHHGGRLLFGKDGTLYVSTGDSGDGDLAQDKNSLNGKILRITTKGKAADGNPFNNRTWTYGHRNIEGLAFDDAGRLWATEFGDKAKDELNLIARGGNYGWPKVEGESDNSDFVNPKVTWGTDDCSPSGLAITRSTAFIGALQGECLFGVPLNAEVAGQPTAYFAGQNGRVRSVAAAPDGALWVTTSNTDGRGEPGENDDRILRITL